jgi:hypothetical protein
MARQQTRMQVDETVPRDSEQTAGDHLAVSHHNNGIRATFFETRIDLFRLEAVGLHAIDLKGTGNADDRRWCEDLMPSNRPIRSGNNQRDLVPAFHQLLEGGHGKIGGSEENDLHPRSVHEVSVS